MQQTSRDSVGSAEERLVTAADIARMAGVTRAAVSNWRRRHEDFPSPTSGSASSPLFAFSAVQDWLNGQGKGGEVSDEVVLWDALRTAYPDSIVTGIADMAEVLAGESESTLPPAVVAGARSLTEELGAEALLSGLSARLSSTALRSGADSATTPALVQAIGHWTGSAASVFDPACGTGSLLLAPGRPDARRAGQDADPDAARLTAVRARLAHPGSEPDIRAGDSLLDDRFEGAQFALVVCDPPVSGSDWGREELLLDPRWETSVPPRAEGELAWLLHAYAHTEPRGRCVVVMSASAAYRRTGRRVRADLVRGGILTDVVALPPGLAGGNSQGVHLWLLSRPEPGSERPQRIRMADLTATEAGDPGDPAAVSAEIPLIDLLDDTVDLTPATHIAPDLADYAREYAALRERLLAAAAQLPDLLPALSPGERDPMAGSLRLAELLEAGMVVQDGAAVRSQSDRVDSDFLNGFLNAPVNTHRSTSASGSFRTEIRAARIPQMGIEEQRRYGAAFRALNELERQATDAAAAVEQAVRIARAGLSDGGLEPEQ